MVIKSIPAKEMPELVENDNFVNPRTCGHGDSSGSDGYVVNDHVGDHKHDPHCKMFLENVKQNGQCYALSGFQENRAPEVLRYEIAYSVVDERGAETAKAYESYPVRQSIIGKRILRRLFNGENTEIVSSSADFSSWGDACSPRMLRYLARNNRKRESMETSYDELSVRRRISSARRNEGGESSIQSGLADNYLIKSEIGNDGHVDDIPSERRKICLAGKRAGKELKGHNSGGTSLRSGSKSEQLAENDFDHDDGDDGVDDDDEYMRFLCSDDGGLGSEGEFLDQFVSDHEDEIDDSDEYHRLCSEGDFLDKCVSVHEDDLDERCARILNYGSRGTIGGSYGGTKLGSEEKFSHQHQSDREYEIRDKDGNELNHEDEIDDSDEYYGLINCVRGRMNGQSNTRPRLVNSHLVKCRCDREDLSDEIDKEYVAFMNQLDKDRENAIYNVEDSTWRFDEVEESKSDIEIMDKDPNSGGARSPFVSSKRVCISPHTTLILLICFHVNVHAHSLVFVLKFLRI